VGNPLDDWLDELCRVLEVPRAAVDRDLVLDLARDAAHGVARPAAPVTTFLVGLAAGRRGSSATDIAADIAAAARTTQELLATREPTNPQ
jgi:hypothetical protein